MKFYHARLIQTTGTLTSKMYHTRLVKTPTGARVFPTERTRNALSAALDL